MGTGVDHAADLKNLAARILWTRGSRRDPGVSIPLDCALLLVDLFELQEARDPPRDQLVSK
jgi:hypothetical protein